MTIDNWTVASATILDIPVLMEFEQQFFPSCWQSPASTFQHIITKELMAIRTLKIGGQIKGYYCVIPLGKDTFEKLLTGVLTEKDALKDMLDFQVPGVCLYIFSMIVDVADEQRKSYTKALLIDFMQHFIPAEGNFANVSDIGAITVTSKGINFVVRAGFSPKSQFKAENGEMATSFVITRNALASQACK